MEDGKFHKYDLFFCSIDEKKVKKCEACKKGLMLITQCIDECEWAGARMKHNTAQSNRQETLFFCEN